jgi:hydrogenase nickel incorporation protein HypA/HybF
MLYYGQDRTHFGLFTHCGILSPDFSEKTMHELPITQNILKIALDYGGKSQATTITAIFLVIGQLSSVIDESIQFYWPIISEGTIAEGAQLHFKRIPARLGCTQCNTVYMIDDGQLTTCPECESSQVKIISGNEFQLESIQIES